MKALGYTCAAAICFGLLWPVLAALGINPWWSPFFGLVVAGPLFALCALFELLAKRAGAVDVKSRAERRLASDPADVDAWLKKALLEEAQERRRSEEKASAN